MWLTSSLLRCLCLDFGAPSVTSYDNGWRHGTWQQSWQYIYIYIYEKWYVHNIFTTNFKLQVVTGCYYYSKKVILLLGSNCGRSISLYVCIYIYITLSSKIITRRKKDHHSTKERRKTSQYLERWTPQTFNYGETFRKTCGAIE